MTKASDNAFPSVLVTESTVPSTPAAGKQRLYIDSTTHLLKAVNSGGTARTLEGSSGSVATDTIWDAAGDIAVGSGADTAAKLSIGGVGGALSRINGVVAWNSGTSFPGSKATGDRYWRSDLGLECYWDGTQWVTVQEYSHESIGDTFVSLSNAVDKTIAYAPVGPGDVYVTTAECNTYVATTNDGSHLWTLTLSKVSTANADTSLGNFTTGSDTASTWTPHTITVGAAVVRSSFPVMRINAVHTSTVGLLFWAISIRYRRIVT